jgi:hypothetical protein
MGSIHPSVYTSRGYEVQHEQLLRAFLPDFDVTWANSYSRFGSDFMIYFLKPEGSIKQTIGIDREIALILSAYSSLQARTFQAADAFLNESPAAGRVESLAYALAAPVADLAEQVRSYQNENRQSRLVVPFTWEELRKPDSWFVRTRFTASLTARDMFDMQQPLINDTYYFGRTALVTDLLDRFRSGENSGLFGLRKTGKTSAVFKLRRQIDSSQAGVALYVDAQTPRVYTLRWWELLGLFAEELVKATPTRPPRKTLPPYSESSAGLRFQELIEHYLKTLPNGKQRILLMVDEIEHIIPELGPDQAKHWNDDFIPFWKTIRAIQTINRSMSLLIVGVNASAVERASIQRQDNPLFSLVGTRYLPSFNRAEVREMVRTIGRPMGIRFEEDAYGYLTARYGGHPTLTRLACSWHHKHGLELGTRRPFTLTVDDLRNAEEACELTLISHVNHILEVLRQWYGLEYEMLQMLAQGNISDFTTLASEDPQLKHHLDEYGLIEWQEGVPRLRIAVIGKFLRVSRRQKSAGTSSEKEIEWMDLVSEISRLRNAFEPKLRRYIKRTLKVHLGPERWIDPLLNIVPTERRAKLQGVDRDEILSDRLFLLDFIQVIETNWDKFFKSLESRLQKPQFSTLARYLNEHRADAHAKDTTQAEVITIAIICESLSAALDESLED